MKYLRIKPLGAYCPKCGRKLELLLPEEATKTLAQFAICFKCRKVHQFKVGELSLTTSLKTLSDERRQSLKTLVTALPDKFQYKAHGSQLRLSKESTTYQRSWLSLGAYEKAFGEAAPASNADFRLTKNNCKWCGLKLTPPRRSFCKDSCSRAYGKATYFKRSLAALPYRIACRDDFYCRVTGEDLAQRNKFGVRIPASNGTLEIHHLIFVSEGGSDHESNLITISQELHRRYHQGEQQACQEIDGIKNAQLTLYSSLMKAKTNSLK